MLNNLSLRYGYAAGFLSCVGLMAAAYYFEYALFLDPCPLCMVQRLATVLTGVGFLLAFILHPKAGQQPNWPLRIALLFTLAAAIFAGWEVNLQAWRKGFPPEEFQECGQGFKQMRKRLPLKRKGNTLDFQSRRHPEAVFL